MSQEIPSVTDTLDGECSSSHTGGEKIAAWRARADSTLARERLGLLTAEEKSHSELKVRMPRHSTRANMLLPATGWDICTVPLLSLRFPEDSGGGGNTMPESLFLMWVLVRGDLEGLAGWIGFGLCSVRSANRKIPMWSTVVG